MRKVKKKKEEQPGSLAVLLMLNMAVQWFQPRAEATLRDG